jgi:hypothetical protein
MSLYGIAASGDLRAPLAKPCGFLLAVMRSREVPARLVALWFEA